MKTIVFYRHKCIGCNACAEMAPHRWRLSGKDGKSVLVGSYFKKWAYQARIPDFEYELALETARQCPMGIIKVSK